MEANSGGSSANSSDFVRKLYKMLENPTDESVVRWGNEGDSFVVLENEKFTKHILPKHFKHSNFASFVRQLNKYDFHKVRHNNEENGQSQYGSGAWEFKHPDFKMNNKDALDNIRRKAPAARKPNPSSDELNISSQQIDMINSQVVATQAQVQALQDKNTELSIQNNMMIQELIELRKTVVNHEQILHNVVTFLNDLDTRRRRESRNLFASTSEGGTSTTLTAADQAQLQAIDDEPPPSPLQHASKLLSETNVDVMINRSNLEQMTEASLRLNSGMVTTPPPDPHRSNNARGGGSNNSAPHSANSSDTMRFSELDTLVYPVGNNNGIDPMYSEHINNIPYSIPPKGPDADAANATTLQSVPLLRKKMIDPGWIRRPHILLVEDDNTCRRIGGKFLSGFTCDVTMAMDGLEAVNKMHEGHKYDLILMDIIMPNLDGVSACHLIRQFDNTPIIAMTSNIRSDDIAMYFSHGMNDVLPKPFTKEGLLQMLEKHLPNLKKPHNPLDYQSGPAPAVQGVSASVLSSRQSLKEEDSPQKSPATTANWASPNQVPGVSPVGSSHTEDYANLVPGATHHPPVYLSQGIPNGMGYGVNPAAAAAGQIQAQMAAAQVGQIPGAPLSAGLAPSLAGSSPLNPQGQFPQQPQQPRSVSGGQGHRRQISDISGGGEDPQVTKRQQMYAPGVPMPRPR